MDATTENTGTQNDVTTFKEMMKKAFMHGVEFIANGSTGDMAQDTPEENLPFAEWFAKHYGDFDDENGIYRHDDVYYIGT